MSQQKSWISKLFALVKPHAGAIIFVFSILSASVTYVLVQGSTNQAIARLTDRQDVLERNAAPLANIPLLVERTGLIMGQLGEIRQGISDVRAFSARLDGYEREMDRVWKRLDNTP